MQPTKEELKRKSAARASAARSALINAGLAIEDIDELHWRLGIAREDGRIRPDVAREDGRIRPAAGFLFWPSAGFWRHPDGRPGSGGLPALIAAVRASSA
jgi:hypothetical protein